MIGGMEKRAIRHGKPLIAARTDKNPPSCSNLPQITRIYPVNFKNQSANRTVNIACGAMRT